MELGRAGIAAAVLTSLTFAIGAAPAAALPFVPAPGSPIAAGLAPLDVAVGDVNADGRADLAVADHDSDAVRILLGDGLGRFSASPVGPIAVGDGPGAIVAGDLDGDGNLDLVTANQNANTLTVLLGDGTGQFTQAAGSPIAVGNLPYKLTLGRVDTGPTLDLLVPEYGDGDMRVLLGDGDGQFTPSSASPIATGGTPITAVLADFDADSKPDAVVAGFPTGGVKVLLGDNAGGFTATPGSPLSYGGSFPAAVAVADYDRDADADIAIADVGDGTITVMLGDGNGAFTPAPGPPTVVGNSPFATITADFDANGIADLAVVNQDDNSISVLLGSGNATFTPAPGSPVATGPRPMSVAAGDFLADGLPDLVTADYDGGTVSVALNWPFLPSAPPAAPTAPVAPPVTTQPPATTPPVATPAARACVVPDLHGRTTGGARTLLEAAGCRLGSVRHVTSRRGAKTPRVVRQTLRAGTRHAEDTKVSVRTRSAKR